MRETRATHALSLAQALLSLRGEGHKSLFARRIAVERLPRVTLYFLMPLSKTPRVRVRRVDSDNWRAVSALEVTSEQRAFVAEPSYYLALCCYGTWNPLAIYLGGTVVGFLMWGIDDDKSCWLGGILIDRAQQRQGYGRAAVKEAIAVLSEQNDVPEFALSYQPGNAVARGLYASMGFVETGETEGDEVVARLRV